MSKILLATDDLEQIPKPVEGGGFELDEGELVYVSPNSLQQWEIIDRVYHLIKDFVASRKLGLVTADAWIEFPSHTVRAPDIAFIPAERLHGIDPRHALKAVPALAVEVLGSAEPALSRRIAQDSGARSAGTPRDMGRRIRQYFDAGVLAVLVIDPEECQVDVYGADELLKTLDVSDTLELPDVLPGLSMRVAQIFEEQGSAGLRI